MADQEINWADFEKVDIRVATVVRAEFFPEARQPAIKLWLRFGPQDVRQSSAQITRRYRPTELVGRQVLAVVNFPPRRIAGFRSDVLVLGVPDGRGGVVLTAPDRPAPEGGKLY